jgi:transcriptional antiterminator NusG
MAEPYWTACRVFGGQEHIVRAKIEEMDRGAFLPTFVRSWVSGGKPSVAERPTLPGYVLFRSMPDDWAAVQDIDGVIGVLANGDHAMRISNDDMIRLTLDHADGANNRFEGCFASPGRGARRNSRKPRASKRARMRSFTVP